MQAPMSLEDTIVQECHAIFDRLPSKCKPRELQLPKAEWIPLSAIAITRNDCGILVLSFGTGMRCHSAKAVPRSEGIVLHDWHAETIAIRGFNRFMVEECHRLTSDEGRTSPVLEWKKPHSTGKQPFSIRDDVKIYMYCSEIPCGDASMELVMEVQEDKKPWSRSATVDEDQPMLLGRGSFDKLGIVRRKPSRADSPVTLSKSCSDKIALKQCTSLLSGPTSLLVSPANAYISTLIVPKRQYRVEACERAFGPSGRLNTLFRSKWLGGYSFQSFSVKTTKVDFAYSRDTKRRLVEETTNSSSEVMPKGSNISIAWIAPLASLAVDGPYSVSGSNILPGSHAEVLVNGRLQGRKEGDPRGASKLSRKRMWEAVAEVLSLLSIPLPEAASYTNLKLCDELVQRRIVKSDATKEALKGWTPNVVDDFEVEPLLSRS